MCVDGHHKGGSRHFRQISVAGVRHWLFYPAMLMCILAIFGVGARVSIATKDKALQGEEKLLKVQHRAESEITDFGVKLVQKLQDLLGVEQPGIMTNSSPNYRENGTDHYDGRETGGRYLSAGLYRYQIRKR